MTGLQTVPIALGERSYDILIDSGLLGAESPWQGLPRSKSALIVTNTTVAPLYLAQLQQRLSAIHADVDAVLLDDGEQYKDWASLERIFARLL